MASPPYKPSGFSGSASGGNGAGARVQAVERQRQVSMPTGPSAPAGAIIGPLVNTGTDGDKWNPYSAEGRISQGPFGAEPPWQDPLEPYGPALGSLGVSFIPGLNSYMVLNDPEASTASKVFAVGSDVMTVVGVGGVIKFAKGSIKLGTGLVRAAKITEGLDIIAGGTEALAARAQQVHGVLHPAAQIHRTTAVLETTAGRIVASGRRDLELVQQAMLVEGEIAGKLPNAHAEVTALETARKLGATPRAIAATWSICPECTAVIEASGGIKTSPTTAVWP
jgi:Cytidine and deoxycytidylate deaminase zinc-binding region